MAKPDYDITLARIAGNIAPAIWTAQHENRSDEAIASQAVDLAEAIVKACRERQQETK